MSAPDLRYLERRTQPRGEAGFRRVVSFGRLELVSIVHSCIYTALLVCAIALGNPQPATTILGFAHGIIWIAMSLTCIAAARFRVIPWWLAVSVAVLGGIGPFFGSAGFIAEARRNPSSARAPSTETDR